MISLLDVSDLNKVEELGVKLHENFHNLYDYEALMCGVNKTYTYKLDNSVVGFIHIQELMDEIDIIDIVIDENHRRKGYALELLSSIINNYPDKKFILEVSKNNIPAINLYEKIGFKQISVRNGYYNGIDALIMEKK